MAGRIHPVLWQSEVLPALTKTAQECLRAFRLAKASHLALPCPRRLMPVLRLVVQPRSGFHEYVLHSSELRNLRLRRDRPVTIERGAAAERSARLKKRFAASLSRRFCSSSSSSVPCSSTARYSTYGTAYHAGPRTVRRGVMLSLLTTCGLCTTGRGRTKQVVPVTHRLVRQRYAAIQPQFLNVTRTPIEAVPADRTADNGRRKEEAATRRFLLFFMLRFYPIRSQVD